MNNRSKLEVYLKILGRRYHEVSNHLCCVDCFGYGYRRKEKVGLFTAGIGNQQREVEGDTHTAQEGGRFHSKMGLLLWIPC